VEDDISRNDVPGTAQPFEDEAQALLQLQRLFRFANFRLEPDQRRLSSFLHRLETSIQSPGVLSHNVASSSRWASACLTLQKQILSALEALGTSVDGVTTSKINLPFARELFRALMFTIGQSPRLTQENCRKFFAVLGHFLERLVHSAATMESVPDDIVQLVCQCATSPLQEISPSTEKVYEAFTCEFLAHEAWSAAAAANSAISRHLMVQDVNGLLLAHSLVLNLRSKEYHGFAHMRNPANRASLLALLINFSEAWKLTSTQDYLQVLSALLSSIADESIGIRRKNKGSDFEVDDGDDEESASTGFTIIRPGSFVHEKVASLITKESIARLLRQIAASGPSGHSTQVKLNDKAKELASFALTLLRFFPDRGDEIRMWLYLGDTGGEKKIAATKYLWDAAMNSSVFSSVSQSPASALRLLKQSAADSTVNAASRVSAATPGRKDEWTMILVFFELYSFALKHTDDEEFFSPFGQTSIPESSATWAQLNALSRSDIQSLVRFLKNISFTMYFNSAELSEPQERENQTGSIRNYFTVSASTPLAVELATSKEYTVAGLPGMTLDHVKRLSTGLLRGLYERHSRRPTLLQVDWLMTNQFQMDGFIEAVVTENDRRSRIEEEDAADAADDEDDDMARSSGVIGMSNVSRLRNLEALKRQQRKLNRIRQMRAVTPRLEILQNLPFFIPFETRVEIFREFIQLDKVKRSANIDADFQFLGGPRSGAERHLATIRRDHVFEDAFEQFYPLNDGLKDPIQITFVDQWNQQEAGIDGGGVTKEFLTSVVKEAFGPDDDLQLFAETDQNLLYPNPTAVEELEFRLKREGLGTASEEFRKERAGLLAKYEFLGRIIGKCLYEGILVDVSFAGFFLLKWALTGGAGLAPKESAYRANLNDLRELDKVLYQNLVGLLFPHPFRNANV
jgi:ubiquitin-protein ligase E3 C